MEAILNSCEVRVLGCLIEKELATPEYYPLTLNALTNACNQKSNRDPVMNLEEADVVRALDALRFKQLAVVSAEGGRAVKYRHILAEKLRLSPAELALLAELLVRGPQTVGELRARSERMHAFTDPAAVEDAIEELMARTPPLVMRLPRQPGRKEQRLAQLFSGEPEPEPCDMGHPADAAVSGAGPGSGRVGQLEAEVAALRAEIEELRRRLEEFMSQFG
jgi:uncharacterized protein YceH (UPF0502 family)